MNEAERIAAGLTKAQRREIAGEARSIGNPERLILVGDWITHNRAAIPTRHRLTKLGLIEHGRFGPTMLTELGLSVRRILSETPHAE